MMDSSAFEAGIERMRAEHRKTLDANASMLADARKEMADERRQHVMVVNTIRLARQRTVDGCRKVIYGRQADIDNAINKANGELEAEQARYGARIRELEARLSELEDNRKRELCEYNARVMNMAGIGIKQEGGEA